MDAQQRQQIADRLDQSNNILVTVSSNPSVDQLAACIGLTLALNKIGKHASAVFSGQVPSTLEFLQPEKTIEKTTDSLRDFIISLDKSKADKLRYKVEDKVVKIFITPYKTSISDKDLEFSQGDFNVDIVLGLGVHNQADIDQAITAHGRILHDAVVSTLNTQPGGKLGTMNWINPRASSLSEMVMQLLKTMNKNVLDGQMATAFLTGIVAETQRFSNAKTSPQTMSISAELMAAGANQQLVATKLEPPKPVEKPPVAKSAPSAPVEPARPPAPVGSLAETSAAPPPKPSEEGTLEINHIDLNAPTDVLLEPEKDKESATPQIDIDREGTLRHLEELQAQKAESALPPSETEGRKILQPLGTAPPAMTGALSEPLTPDSNGFSLPQPNPEDIERPSGAPPVSSPGAFGSNSYSPLMPPANQPLMPTGIAAPPSPPPVSSLADDTSVAALPGTPSVSAAPSPSPSTIPPNHVSNARDAVHQAINSQPLGSAPLPPIAALNALPVNLPLRDDQSVSSAPTEETVAPAPGFPADSPQTPGTPPPPVPPPMLPPTQ